MKVRATLIAAVGVVFIVAAVALSASTASAASYVPMRNAAAVARSYQVFLNRSGFSQQCKAASPLMVYCWGTADTNDPKQRWHPWSTEIRKVPIMLRGRRVFAAERRIWMDYEPIGKPSLDRSFVRWARLKGW
jgi:hypothetical protein